MRAARTPRRKARPAVSDASVRPPTKRVSGGAGLQRLRRQIDQLDGQIVRMLGRRAALAVRAAQLKRRQSRPIFDRRRERQVLHQVLRHNRGPLSRAALEAVYRHILRVNRALGSQKSRS